MVKSPRAESRKAKNSQESQNQMPQEVFWHLNSLDQEGFSRMLRHLLQPQEIFMERQHLARHFGHLGEPKPVQVPKRILAKVETSLEVLRAGLDGALRDLV